MNGTLRPNKDAGGLMRRGVVLLAALLLVCTLMAGAVSAEENAVTVTIGEYTQSYSTLVEAFADAVNFSIGNNSQLVTVTLNKDLSGGGIGIFNDTLSVRGLKSKALPPGGGIGIFNDTLSGSKKSVIVLDLGSHTYTCVGPAVGSTGTKSQAFWRKDMISLSRMVRLLHLHPQRMSICLCRSIVI